MYIYKGGPGTGLIMEGPIYTGRARLEGGPETEDTGLEVYRGVWGGSL